MGVSKDRIEFLIVNYTNRFVYWLMNSDFGRMILIIMGGTILALIIKAVT